MLIYTIIGARPQFIKAAAVSKAFKKINQERLLIQEKIIHTGQHYDKNMSDNFFDELEIEKPLYNLDINKGNHGSNTGRMLEEIEKILIKDKPDGKQNEAKEEAVDNNLMKEQHPSMKFQKESNTRVTFGGTKK